MTRPSVRHVLPEFTERPGAGRGARDPYARMPEGRVVLLGAPIDEAHANEVTARLMCLERQAPERDIALYINSPGGSLDAMSMIYDAMRYVSCEVATTCLGRAGSPAAVLLAAGAPGKRYLLPGARVTIGPPPPGPWAGRTGDPAVHLAESARVREALEDLLVRHTGRTAGQVAADLGRDTVLDARGALEYGLADRIAPSRKASRSTPGTR